MHISNVERKMLFGSASDSKESVWNTRNAPLKWPARIVGLLSAALVISSQYANNSVLDSAGKCFFWTALVLLPVLVLNRDLYSDIWAWIIAVLLFGVQLTLVGLAWERMGAWSFITITPVAFMQLMLFFAPFLVLRRYRGLTYPPVEEESK
jgi:hypothetical protein